MSEADNAEEQSAETAHRPFYKRPWPIIAMLCMVVLVVLGIGWYWLVSQQYVSTENAFLEGDLIQVAPQVAGPIAKVLVQEKTHVEKGDLLVQLDPADYKIALAEASTRLEGARAELEQARAKLAVAQTNVATAQSDVTVAQARADNAKDHFQRLQQVDKRAVPRQKVDRARHQRDQSAASLKAARHKVKSARAKVKAAHAGIPVAMADIDKAQTGLDKARLRLSHTRIIAPISGQVAVLGKRAGEYVSPGQALLTLVPDQVWVKANFKETQITHMRVGQSVKIRIDAFPGQTFSGHVVGIQHGTGAEFALLPAQNATGNFIKIVQRVPVRIRFDKPPDVYTLAPGLSVVPTVKVLPHPPWPW